MVSVETEGAEAVLDALASRESADVERALDACTLQLDFYTTHLPEVTRETFERLLTAPEDAPDGFAVDELAEGFAEASDRIEVLRERVAALAAVETAAIERDVRRYLPEEPAPDLDATVHAVVDGFNGGYQHRGDVAVSVLGTRPDQFGVTLRHELHHVGAREVREDDPFGRLSRPVSPARDAADLVAVLLLEGLAIAYAQGGLRVYADRPALAETVDGFRERETALFADLEDTLDALVATEDADERQSLVESVAVDPEGALPPTHYLGARMVEAVGATFGRDRAVDLVTDVEAVLPTYQAAARDRDGYRFDPETVERVSDAVAAVES